MLAARCRPYNFTAGFLFASLCLLSATAFSDIVTNHPVSQAYLKSIFAVEGNIPYPTNDDGTLMFSAMDSKFNSGNGHGYRNEVKVIDALRHSVSATKDHFSATITPLLPAGCKTIVAQYHVESLDTELKVYIQDTKESGAFNGVNGDGVFDVLVRILGTNGKETMTPLAQIKSGESFRLAIDLDGGAVTVMVESQKKGRQMTRQMQIKDLGKKIYFKFGDYLQALDVATGGHTTDSKKWDAYYQAHQIDRSQIKFSEVNFSHE
jgi:hypothetical protein